MSTGRSFIRTAPGLFAAAVLLTAGLTHGATADANPFARLAGHWKGDGTWSPIKGVTERVRCRVNYGVSGANVTQNIECAGADYRISATSKLVYADGKMTGHWAETNYGAGGGATGTVSGNTFFVRISGEKFNGRMSINVNGSQQTVKITQFDAGSGKYSNMASISLHR